MKLGFGMAPPAGCGWVCAAVAVLALAGTTNGFGVKVEPHEETCFHDDLKVCRPLNGSLHTRSFVSPSRKHSGQHLLQIASGVCRQAEDRVAVHACAASVDVQNVVIGHRVHLVFCFVAWLHHGAVSQMLVQLVARPVFCFDDTSSCAPLQVGTKIGIAFQVAEGGFLDIDVMVRFAVLPSVPAVTAQNGDCACVGEWCVHREDVCSLFFLQ